MFTAADILLALPWLAITVLLPLLLRDRPRLDRIAPVEDADAGPLVSIIVPARNEAANIGTCLATLLDSGYANREIIVVDDHSTDGTGDIARILAERADGAIRLIEGQPLPDGWIGKCWACWQGYEVARGDVLLFTDADTRHDEQLLPRALGALHAHDAALVSLLPRQLMHGFWERTVLPHIFIMISARFHDLERVNRARNPRDVIANGQFMLFRRADYEALDGHRGVRGEVVEDLRLAQHVVKAGRRLFIANAERMMETRMYRSLAGIIEGWSKNLAHGSRNTVDAWLRPALPWIIGLGVLALWVVPPLLLSLTFLGVVHPALRSWGILVTSTSAVFWIFGYLRFRLPVLHALLFPLGGLLAGLLFLRSARRGGSIGWKGRVYQVDAAGGVRAADQLNP